MGGPAARLLRTDLIGTNLENLKVQHSYTLAEKEILETHSMANTVPAIGIEPAELTWIRMLVLLLRHSDPVVPELTRHALLYLEVAAARSDAASEDRDIPAVN